MGSRRHVTAGGNKGKMPTLEGCEAGQGEEAARPLKKVDPQTKTAVGGGKELRNVIWGCRMCHLTSLACGVRAVRSPPRPHRRRGEGLQWAGQQDPPPKWRHVRPVRLQLGPDCFPEALQPPPLPPPPPAYLGEGSTPPQCPDLT